MQRFTFKLFLLIAFLFLSNVVLLAQVNWTKYPGNPVLIGQPGTWYAYTTMNSVLYNADSSRYEMWFTAGAQIEIPYTIGFAWSSDGISWNVYSPNPVLTPTPGEWDAYTVLAPYVIRENGQYKMWYTGCATNQFFNRIGYATSPDGINWTKYPSNPILLPGTAAWESAGVAYPCIMPYSNGYKMWYGGYSANLSVSALGYATSPDGITWEKYAGNPIVPAGASGQWDHVLFAPRVLFIDNIYYMFYTGETVVYQSDKIGLATSADGSVWKKYPSNPVLQPTSGQWDGGRTSLGSVLLDADTLKMYYCGMPVGGTNMQLGMATSPYTPLPLPPGTYTVGTDGNFATIQESFTKLETDGVAGNVTLELIDELYTAPTTQYGFQLNGPIPGAGPNSRVTIKPAENKNVVIEGNGRYLMTCINTSYMTVDGVSISGVTTLAFHANKNAQYTWNGCLDFVNNSDHNFVQNINFISDDFYGVGPGPVFETIQGSSATADSNLIQNNFIKKAGIAIYVGTIPTLLATGNIVRGNIVGSETDSLIGWGIQLEYCKNTIVENNIVQNLKVTHTIGEIVNMGINSWVGSNIIIRNNVVHGIRSNAGYMSVGINLSGSGGTNSEIYNNMIYDIQSSSTNYDSRVSGIQIFYQSNPKVYYNTVYLSGKGANRRGSAALYIYDGVTNADVKNNIFVNTRDESPYCASAIYDYTASNLSSDYNVLYYDENNNNSCLARIINTKYSTLAEWQAVGKDQHSYVEMPHFVAANNLHINNLIPTNIESGGIPIAGIETDFDGDLRNASKPDIGADEINGIVVPVELLSFIAEAENQKVVLRWTTATELNNNGFEIQRKVVESDFVTVGFVRGEGTSTNQREYSYIDKDLADGKYFYRLKQVDYNGTYEYTNTIEVDVRSLNEYALEQNYPNPFNPTTTIGYVLKDRSNAKLILLNAIGEEMAVLVNEEQDKGFHKVEFNAANLPSGVYFYQLKAGDFMSVKKMLLIK